MTVVNRSGNNRFTYLITAVIILIPAAFFLYNLQKNVPYNTETSTSTEGESRDYAVGYIGDPYPSIYVSFNLPQYPNSFPSRPYKNEEFTDPNLVEFSVVTNDSVAKISSFYEEELKNTGWTVPVPQLNIATKYQNVFTKENQTLEILIVNYESGETAAKITYKNK